MTNKNDDPTKEKPAKPTTSGYKNDPRAKAADNLEQDNENKLGEHLDNKHDKTGG